MNRQGLILVAALGALALGILAVAGTWSALTPTQPAVSPDTVSTPNPDGARK